MTVKFYYYTKQRTCFNKAPYLDESTAKTFDTVKVAGDQDIERPVLTVYGTGSLGVLDYTYCYIQDWGRYYFITSRRWMSDNTYQITLSEDYIYTAKTLLEVQTGFCRYSGLGDTDLFDGRITFKPEATIKNYDLTLQSANYNNNLYCLRFYSAQPFKNNEYPAIWNGTNIAEACAFMSYASLAAFISNYNSLAEVQRVAVGKAIISISYVPMGCFLTASAPDVTGLHFATSWIGSGIDVDCTGQFPALDFCKLVYSPEVVSTGIDPINFAVTENGQIYSFNTHARFWELDALYTLKHSGLQPINIDPTAYGKKDNFTIEYSITYEPYSDQYIVRLFPSVQNGNYTPIIQKNMLTVPFMVDTSLQQIGFNNIAQALNMAGGLTGGIINLAQNFSISGLISGGLNIAGEVINAGAAAERRELADQVGYTVNGEPGIAMFYAATQSGIGLYQVYREPVSTPWNNKGIPDCKWRSILSLAGSGYAEVDIPEITDNIFNFSVNELNEIKTRMSQGVIFNAGT